MVKFNFVYLFSGGRRRRQLVGNIKKNRIYWKFMRKQNIALCGELVWEGLWICMKTDYGMYK